jgi:Sec-independent protein translocase protein TatA
VEFGTKVLFLFVLGIILPGPKRLPAILGSLAPAKPKLEKPTPNFKSQLKAELETRGHNRQVNSYVKAGGEQ